MSLLPRLQRLRSFYWGYAWGREKDSSMESAVIVNSGPSCYLRLLPQHLLERRAV